ncbi:hypothetical protein [Kitasatospora sp. NPDC006786]|uniref:hypothetical protein n=1 Tax=unclassified Kitasatospora TaxID=2633591 RepID=UPI0033CC316B
MHHQAAVQTPGTAALPPKPSRTDRSQRRPTDSPPHRRNEVSKNVTPPPPVAQLIVARPDGTPLGVLALDDQDAEILVKCVHEMSADRYGPLFATDLEGV